MICNNKLFIFLLLLLAVNFTGCEGKQEEGSKKKVAVVVSTLNNPWFVVLAETAAEEARQLGYEVNIFDSQNNTAVESEHFENAIVGGYDAILFNPTDAEGSVSNVVKAVDSGLAVFTMDREVNSNRATSQILSDNYAGTVSLGKYFVDQLNKKGKYVELLGLVGDNNTWNRSEGFHSVVDYYPDLVMVAQQSADFDRNKAMQVMESILQVHKDIDAVFCGNDAMAMGAYQALKAAGLEQQVKVFGFDGADNVIQAIEDGRIAATAMQFPKVMAKTAAILADKYMNGEREFIQKLPVDVELVHPGNVDHYTAYGKKK
ncbi:D-ribose ABC transporter substrate-binding protein [Autumnicola psychrophila]|uniref:D-ribose ABC transporter substrate-binding protein n=1 Tax=Autumnicola psychrophila TaxID=3075592 RepID=A0ABU3DU49_9FLAO|nr:D-ribose ABC transporter substrate-binding protein [Zunongwangia sp. F225]MDT0687233.1 D-ribose ABC transporter substrate-binding protein [Zunongwangia sp. F225]